MLLLSFGIHRVNDRWKFSTSILCDETGLPNHNLSLSHIIDASSNQILCWLRMLVIDLSHVLVKHSALILGTYTDSFAHCIRGLFVHSV